jgi:hypothetical protein
MMNMLAQAKDLVILHGSGANSSEVDLAEGDAAVAGGELLGEKYLKSRFGQAGMGKFQQQDILKTPSA